MEIKTRFAPSPTGSMHIGSVRTALYAYLIAKKAKGIFSLRIEDTDQARLVEGSVEDIIATLKWLGLEFDGEIIYQSKRQDIYKEHAKKLVDGGFAYENMGAIYFKTKKEGKSKIIDLVGNREIEFENSTQDDFVILKSGSYPTYHLAHVVDDHLMETNPVIRGAEWISSIPKHVQLFEAFGWVIPQYAHLPPSSGKEILSIDEMIEGFDLGDVNLANPVFDITKLEWMNGEYIRKLSDGELLKKLQEFLVDHSNKQKISLVVPLIKERIKKLSDFVPLTDFLWEVPEYDKQEFDKLKVKSKKEILTKILEKMENMEKPWRTDVFEKTFRELAEELGEKAGDLFQLIRVAVSGQLVTPPLFESIKILGEEETLIRVESAIGLW
ncbi:MAG: Glutamate-tRNA ligase 2 [Candidatus Daviesbacteria bacterium GW2011_GWA2_38_17]|nr:MAG: Glutamate-tRNA ligase 2 [Candidatus Daviesbacteria bacterium GW2011_GWA2_38_17]